MSWEGYYQCLCQDGHYFENHDIYDYSELGDQKCPHCGKEAVFENQVDQTNNPADGIIDFNKHFLIEAAYGKICDMNHWHQTMPAKYRIPTMEEADKVREYTVF